MYEVGVASEVAAIVYLSWWPDQPTSQARRRALCGMPSNHARLPRIV
jgi:hypothetical protein